MESKKSPVKFTKYLLMLQILIVTGIAICEIIQVVEINKYQKPIIDNPEDWDYLLGYTGNKLTIVMKIYYWFALLASIGILGWSLKSFEKRWKNIQTYDDKSLCLTLLTLWCIATIPSVILLFSSEGLRNCKRSANITGTLLNHCHAYLASLILAYIFIITLIVQLSYSFTILKHQKQNIVPFKIQEPKKLKIKRSRHVSRKKRASYRSSIYSNSTKLSVVTEDEEDARSFRSSRSERSNKSKGHETIQITKNNMKELHLKSEKRVSFNV